MRAGAYKFVLRNKRKTNNFDSFEVLDTTPKRSVRSRRRKRTDASSSSNTSGSTSSASLSSTPSPSSQQSGDSPKADVSSIVTPLEFPQRRVVRRQRPVEMPQPTLIISPETMKKTKMSVSRAGTPTVRPIKILQRPRQINRVVTPLPITDYRKITGKENIKQKNAKNEKVSSNVTEQKMASSTQSPSESRKSSPSLDCKSEREKKIAISKIVRDIERKQKQAVMENSIANHIERKRKASTFEEKKKTVTIDNERKQTERKLKDYNDKIIDRKFQSPQKSQNHKSTLDQSQSDRVECELSDSEAEELSEEGEKKRFDDFLTMLDNLDTSSIYNDIVGNRKTLSFPKKKSLVIYESSSVWDATIDHDNSSWDSYLKKSRRKMHSPLSIDDQQEHVAFALDPSVISFFGPSV